MKDKNWSIPFFLLRSPQYPLSKTLNLIREIKNNGAEVLLKHLDIDFSEALYLASPVLHSAATTADIGEHFNKKTSTGKSVSKSLLKYFTRAGTRCTPFGLFASCCVGKIGQESTFHIPRKNTKRHIRLDMDFLCHLSVRLKEKREIRNNLIYYPNSTLYEVNGKFKYIEYRYDFRGTRTFHLNETRKNIVISDILKRCRKGLSYYQICSEIADLYDLDNSEIEEYVGVLIENNVLYSSIEPSVTGEEYFENVFRELRRICKIEPAIEDICMALESVVTSLRKIELEEDVISSYQSIFGALKALFPDMFIDETKLFQMDAVKSSRSLTLAKKDVGDLIDSIQELDAFNSVPGENLYLNQFKRLFLERYDEQVVRLVDALDSETGIGYKNPNNPKETLGKGGAEMVSNPLEDLAMRKYISFLREGGTIIRVEERDILPAAAMDRLPDNFTIMANAIKGEEGIEFYISGMSISNTNLFGRFCHSDPDLYKEVRNIIESDTNENCISAEVAHLPQSRTGNVISRPQLTDYEIEFLSLSMADLDKKISVADLYIKVEKNELVLFSKSLAKRIIPRLSSAHNFSAKSLDIYHFLCDLQYQNQRGISLWNWGKALEKQPYLPRVMYKKCILSLARWRFDCKEINEKIKGGSNMSKEIEEFRRTYGLPNLVVLMEADNHLVLDLSLDLCKEILVKEIKRHYYLDVYEFIFPNTSDKLDDLLVMDEEKAHYVNEIFIPVTRKNRRKMIDHIDPNWLKPIKTRRTFYFGSEWLYLKIYAKARHWDEIIVLLSSTLAQATNEGKADSWFFLKYFDPLPHVRIRIKSDHNFSYLVPAIYKRLKKLMENEYIQDISTSTYKREIERYGDSTIILGERIFHLNSELVAKMLSLKQKQQENYDLILSAVFIVDRTLDAFKLTGDEKIHLLERQFRFFATEFLYESDPNLKKRLSQSFRDLKIKIDETLKVERYSLNDGKAIARFLAKLQNELVKNGNGPLKDYNFIASQIHMFINRAFSDNPRMIEFSLYYYLYSHHKSRKARSIKELNKNELIEIS